MTEITTVDELDKIFTDTKDELVLVDFWAPWCGPCKALAPKLEELDKKFTGAVKIVKVNADLATGLTSKYGIRGIPALIMFKEGVEVDQKVGNHPMEALEEFFQRNISTL